MFLFGFVVGCLSTAAVGAYFVVKIIDKEMKL